MSKFLKGHRGYWAGKQLTEETKLKMSLVRKGRPALNKGIKDALETKILKSKSHLGKNTWSKGSQKSVETKTKMSKAKTHEKHPNWKGGKSRNKHSLTEPKYKEWRMAVFIRDKFKCRIADMNCKGQLQPHHILRWADYPELRYAINNGITLCVAHHPRKRSEEAKLSPYFKNLVAEMN